jgi:hypothetical protein
MLKRLTPLAAVAALLALAAIVPAPPVHADRQYQLCDPFKSTLCQGLVALYEFEEDSDNARTSETGGAPFLEPDGANVARSYSLTHTATANSYVYIPRTTGFSGTFTMSFWIYIDTPPSGDAKFSYVLSMKDAAGLPAYPAVPLQAARDRAGEDGPLQHGLGPHLPVLSNLRARSVAVRSPRRPRCGGGFEVGSYQDRSIDGDHRYHSVADDIELGRVLVRDGGILAGHDWGRSDWPGVKRAVCRARCPTTATCASPARSTSGARACRPSRRPFAKVRLRLVDPASGTPVNDVTVRVQVRGRTVDKLSAPLGELEADVPVGAVLVLEAPGRPVLRRTL